MNPSFFSRPAVFAAIPEDDAAAGDGDVDAVRAGDAQPAATLEMRKRESADALLIMTKV